jgi:uncharacterized protein GlcG (DUF336 family)
MVQVDANGPIVRLTAGRDAILLRQRNGRMPETNGREVMSIYSGLAVGLLAACLIPATADAQVLMQRDVSLRMALMIAETASAECGAIASIAVVDRAGRIKVLLQGDGGSPHNLELARRKAYTARTFRRTSAEWAKRTETTNPGQRMLTDVIPLGGGVPINVGKETIGGIGLSGAPGGQPKEEACARAGIAKVADQLK